MGKHLKNAFFVTLIVLVYTNSAFSECKLSKPIKLNNTDLISQETIIQGTFENNPNEVLKFKLIAPQFGPLFAGKYIDQLGFNFATKPSTLEIDRFMRMSEGFDSNLFIKFALDIVKLDSQRGQEISYNTIYTSRANPQPSPFHWTSSFTVKIKNNEIYSVEFWTPKNWKLNERVYFCLVQGELVSQSNRPPENTLSIEKID